MGTLSYTYGKPYGYTGQAHTCHWCGDVLRAEQRGGAGGYRDNGRFCSLRCGYQWAARQLRAEPWVDRTPVEARRD